MNRLFKRLKIQRINDHIWLLNDHDDGTGYLVTGTDKALVIDTMYGQEDLKEAVKTLTDLPLMLVNTHGHFDHIWGVEGLKKCSGARVYAYEGEKELCESDSLNVSRDVGRPCTVTPDVLLKDGQKVEIAGMQFQVIATPGHTKGSCCYYFEEAGVLLSGDTLFQDSVGRTDLPTGSMSALVRSVREKLMVLPDDVTVYPGHGECTSIGHERKYNAFL